MQVRGAIRRLWTFCTVVLTIAVARPARAQYQAESINVSRNFHDLAWVAAGATITLTLKELGVRPAHAALLGSVGVVTAVKLLECTRLCDRRYDWPMKIAVRDAVYDMVLTSGVTPLLVGKRKGWQAGLLTGAAWIGSVIVLREARWNSP